MLPTAGTGKTYPGIAMARSLMFGLLAAALCRHGAVCAGELPALAVAAPSARSAPSDDSANDLRRMGPGTAFRDCGDCPEMVVLPPGRFLMGSAEAESGRLEREGPLHAVSIRHSLAVGKYEITRSEFARFVEETGYAAGDGCVIWGAGRAERDVARNWRNPGFHQSDRDPIVCVSWYDAKAYVQWLSMVTAKPYRLLSEAEWEYAARAGQASSRPWGEEPGEACAHANVADATAKAEIPGTAFWVFHECNDGWAYTAPVGRFRPNSFGLHDMIGNVWEWTEDCWNETYAGAPSDGSAWTSGDCVLRILRGGSWNDLPRLARSAYRDRVPNGDRDAVSGFRVARSD